jgi:hypothetical protein
MRFMRGKRKPPAPRVNCGFARFKTLPTINDGHAETSPVGFRIVCECEPWCGNICRLQLAFHFSREKGLEFISPPISFSSAIGPVF